MSPKKLIPLALVFVALVAAAVWNHAQNRRERAGMEISRQPAEVLGLPSDPAFISRIEIFRLEGEGDQRLVLVKREASESWVIENHFGTKVRKEAPEKLLKQLGGVRGEIRAEDEAVLSDFRLKEEQAIHIRLSGSDGNARAYALLSPLRPRGTQNFIRKAGSNRVLMTTTDLLGGLGVFSEEDKLKYLLFADLRPLGIGSAKVMSLEFATAGSSAFRLERHESEKGSAASWVLAQDPKAEVDPSRVNQFLASVYNLYANESVDPAAHANDFAGVSAWLKIGFMTGETPERIEVVVAPPGKDPNIRRVRVLPDNLVYELSEGAIDSLLKNTKDFFIQAKSA